MLGGVHAGRAELLSARSAVPDVAAVAGRHRSLLRAVRSLEPRTGAGPALNGLEGGMGRLVSALRAGAQGRGAEVSTGRRVVRLARREPGGYRIGLAGGGELEAHTVVVAAQSWAAAALLGSVVPEAAAAVAQTRYAGVATVSLVYDAAALTGAAALPPGTGFLVPPNQNRLLVGCTWLTSKWPQPADASTVVLRAMVGRDGDQRWADLDDERLESAIVDELVEALGISRAVLANPLTRIVRRMPNALPQYTVGHADRLAAAEAALAGAPGLFLTGAGYRGLGIAACLGAAERVADQVAAAAAPAR
jgi:oxygen-dependent protoporphyrinogen oxidase